MNTTKLKFGDEDTTLRELADYVFQWLEDEVEPFGVRASESLAVLDDEFQMRQKRCLADAIEEALKAFYGGARND